MEGCGVIVLLIGWYFGIVKELVENCFWNDEMFKWFCEEVCNGVFFNRVVIELKIGSLTCGGKLEIIVV